MTRIWARVPIAAKLTLLSTAVMACALAGLGLFLYGRVKADLDGSLTQSLIARTDDLAALVRRSPPSGRSILELPPGEGASQVTSLSGRVLIADRRSESRPLLRPGEIASARRGTLSIFRGETAILLARPVVAGRRTFIIATETPLALREHTLERLTTILLVGGPLLLLLSAAVGFAVARAALRPVEAMRARAASISDTDTAARLPLPRARDEIHRLGDTLNSMLARLQRALEHERAFVSDASHELRTPIAVLKGELELALAEPNQNDAREHVEAAVEETDRLARLAEDLLIIARADSGRLPVRTESLGADELFAQLAARFASRLHHLRTLRVEGAGLMLRADPLRIEQALGNLIDNALRHGGGTVTVTAHAAVAHIELHVLDEGDGFPADLLEADRAFDRFRHGALHHDGAGLGLAISRVIARAHGGEARIANRNGGGADAWITLPWTPPPASLGDLP